MSFAFSDPELKPLAEKVEAVSRLSFEDGMALYQTTDLAGLGYLANRVRER